VDAVHRRSAETARSQIARERAEPSLFRASLTRVPAAERDAWLDLVLDLGELPDDGPDLPRGCVPYVPCPVDTLLRVVEHAPVRASDVFVDIGSGAGRATALVHLLTGATVVGLEIQPALVRAARDLFARLRMSRASCAQGDAASLAGQVRTGTVFFLYCSM
jgi:SAM-dependent methyltransferase